AATENPMEPVATSQLLAQVLQRYIFSSAQPLTRDSHIQPQTLQHFSAGAWFVPLGRLCRERLQLYQQQHPLLPPPQADVAAFVEACSTALLARKQREGRAVASLSCLHSAGHPHHGLVLVHDHTSPAGRSLDAQLIAQPSLQVKFLGETLWVPVEPLDPGPPPGAVKVVIHHNSPLASKVGLVAALLRAVGYEVSPAPPPGLPESLQLSSAAVLSERLGAHSRTSCFKGSEVGNGCVVEAIVTTPVGDDKLTRLPSRFATPTGGWGKVQVFQLGGDSRPLEDPLSDPEQLPRPPQGPAGQPPTPRPPPPPPHPPPPPPHSGHSPRRPDHPPDQSHNHPATHPPSSAPSGQPTTPPPPPPPQTGQDHTPPSPAEQPRLPAPQHQPPPATPGPVSDHVTTTPTQRTAAGGGTARPEVARVVGGSQGQQQQSLSPATLSPDPDQAAATPTQRTAAGGGTARPEVARVVGGSQGQQQQSLSPATLSPDPDQAAATPTQRTAAGGGTARPEVARVVGGSQGQQQQSLSPATLSPDPDQAAATPTQRTAAGGGTARPEVARVVGGSQGQQQQSLSPATLSPDPDQAAATPTQRTAAGGGTARPEVARVVGGSQGQQQQSLSPATLSPDPDQAAATPTQRSTAGGGTARPEVARVVGGSQGQQQQSLSPATLSPDPDQAAATPTQRTTAGGGTARPEVARVVGGSQGQQQQSLSPATLSPDPDQAAATPTQRTTAGGGTARPEVARVVGGSQGQQQQSLSPATLSPDPDQAAATPTQRTTAGGGTARPEVARGVGGSQGQQQQPLSPATLSPDPDQAAATPTQRTTAGGGTARPEVARVVGGSQGQQQQPLSPATLSPDPDQAAATPTQRTTAGGGTARPEVARVVGGSQGQQQQSLSPATLSPDPDQAAATPTQRTTAGGGTARPEVARVVGGSQGQQQQSLSPATLSPDPDQAAATPTQRTTAGGGTARPEVARGVGGSQGQQQQPLSPATLSPDPDQAAATPTQRTTAGGGTARPEVARVVGGSQGQQQQPLSPATLSPDPDQAAATPTQRTTAGGGTARPEVARVVGGSQGQQQQSLSPATLSPDPDQAAATPTQRTTAGGGTARPEVARVVGGSQGQQQQPLSPATLSPDPDQAAATPTQRTTAGGGTARPEATRVEQVSRAQLKQLPHPAATPKLPTAASRSPNPGFEAGMEAGGLAQPHKLQALLDWAADSPAQVVFLQECHKAESVWQWAEALSGAKPAWRGQWFYTPGTGSSQGCLVLVKPSTLLKGCTQVQLQAEAAQGRVLRVDGVLAGRSVSLVCVYAPAQQSERSTFFSVCLPACLPPSAEGRLIIMGGDFNCILSPWDRVGVPQGSQHGEAWVGSRGQGAEQLRQLVTERGLVDAWRQLRPPSARDLTHFSERWQTGARLDRWYVSEGLAQWQLDSTILGVRPVPTDHQPVSVSLCPPDPPLTAPAPWQLHPAHLDDPELLDYLKGYLQAEDAHHEAARQLGTQPRDGHRARWARIKQGMALRAQQFLRTKRRARRDLRQRREKAALAARAHLVRQLQQAEQVGQAEVLAAQHLGETTALAGVGERVQVAHQSLLASAVLDQVYGDRSSFFFYHRDQPAHTPTLISSLQLPGQPGLAADLTTPNGVRSACQAFELHYSAAAPAGVYAAKAIDPAARAALLTCLTSRLTPAQARAAEGPGGDPMLSEEELGRALQGSAHSKAPGLDGLPMEVYDRLWPQLVGPLRAMLREALADTSDPAPLAEFLTGVITLVPKAGKPRDQVAGYRPITLLNCDVRLVARALEDRLQLPLDLLVSPSQSAFILGRDINDSVQFHLGLLEWLQQRHSPAWLLLLDLAGAYDNVSWSLLQDTLVAMGFSQQGHVRWAQLLHRGATSQVLVNGYLTDSFPLASGLLQGSGASPLYWCVVLQPLVSYLSSLQRAGRITTPAIPTSPLAMHAATLTPALPTKEYADDLTILVADRVKDGEVVVEALVRFRAAGGPALSVSKSVALPCVQPVTGEAAYGGAAAAITAASLPWQPLGLNLLGRVQVAQQCLVSKVVYQMAAVQPPKALAQAMALAIKRFVAASDLPQERSPNSNRLYPSEAICVMPRREGGVGLPDLGVISTAMRAKMLAQLWSPRVRPWQPLTHSLLADPSHGLSTWVITDPSAPPSRNITPRLQAHVAALAQLRLFRVVPPESQSFYSVMAEPLWFNPLIRLIPSARQEAEGQGWTHVRHVREALQRQSQHEGVTRWAADLVRACLPEPWQQWVDLRDPPPPDWECLRVGPGVGFVARCHPALHPSHWVAPNGRLLPLNPTGQGPLGTFQVVEGAVWEPAAVARLNKPNYLLTPEERATHLRPLPAGRLGGQGQEGGQGQGQEEWLLGPWAHLQLDPQVWGLGTTTLLEFTVRDAKVRLHQLQRVSVDALYPPGGGLWPVLWGRRPPREAGVAQGTAVDGEAFRELEERWQASAQQVTAQRAAEEREQQGRDAEELLPEEVQGSQAPRWRDTSARAPPRPSPEQRAAERAERQLEAQQGPRRTGRQPATLQVPPDGTVDELAAAARPGQSCLQVWKELMDPTLRREHAIVAWRVLHGSLMVGALWGHILKGAAAPGSSDCRLCQPGQLETLTHAFLTCPAVAPVWEWVLDVYGHLTGTRPPSGDALLLLSGRPTRSEAPPFQPPDSLLWLRLRVAYLGTVWRLRSSGAATALQPQMVAQRVAEEVVLTLSSAVKRDWHRVGRDIRVGLCGAVPSTWFRGTDPELGADQFDRLWPEPSGGWFAKEGAEERALERVGGREAGGIVAGARQREERAFGAVDLYPAGRAMMNDEEYLVILRDLLNLSNCLDLMEQVSTPYASMKQYFNIYGKVFRLLQATARSRQG
ncbi:hypothetical protein QJQ45_027158, partial [Haematococcus lacustris]